MSNMLLTGALALGWAAGPASPAAAAAGPRVVTVPLLTRQFHEGSDIRSLVVTKVRVARGKTVSVWLDTGSSGLTILSSALGPAARSTGRQFQFAYLDDPVVGTLEHAAVSIGGLSTPRSTDVVAVSRAADPKLASDLRHVGVVGILGVGMADGATAVAWRSPLQQLPSPYWKGLTVTVHATGAGTLAIGPVTAAADAVAVPMTPATPAHYADGRPAYEKDLDLCWSAGRGPKRCGTTDIDLGAGSPVFDPNALPDARVTDHVVITPGTHVRASTPSGEPIWSYTAGTSEAKNVTLLVAQGYTEFNTGINFFFDHVVSYDLAHGRFLLAPSPKSNEPGIVVHGHRVSEPGA